MYLYMNCSTEPSLQTYCSQIRNFDMAYGSSHEVCGCVFFYYNKNNLECERSKRDNVLGLEPSKKN